MLALLLVTPVLQPLDNPLRILLRGGLDDVLASGDTLEETESAVDLESLIGKYAFGGV